MLEQLDVAVAPARVQASRRAREAFPDAAAERLEQEHFAARPLERQACGQHTRVVDDNELAAELLRQVREEAMTHLAPATVVDKQARGVAARGGMLGDQLRREVVVELARIHPVRGLLSLRGRSRR